LLQKGHLIILRFFIKNNVVGDDIYDTVIIFVNAICIVHFFRHCIAHDIESNLVFLKASSEVNTNHLNIWMLYSFVQ